MGDEELKPWNFFSYPSNSIPAFQTTDRINIFVQNTQIDNSNFDGRQIKKSDQESHNKKQSKKQNHEESVTRMNTYERVEIEQKIEEQEVYQESHSFFYKVQTYGYRFQTKQSLIFPFVRKKNIAKGGFGQIYDNPYFTYSDIVIKFINYENNMSISQTLQEFWFCGFCSLMKLSMNLISNIVKYNNKGMWFFLEKGLPIGNQFQYKIKLDKFTKDLQENLKKLHDFRIVHRDIKPNNIVYSYFQDRFFFIDFGLTENIKQDFQTPTKTYYCGTPGFLSQEMKNIKQSKNGGFVNLYKNDIYAMETSLIKIKRYQQIQQFCRIAIDKGIIEVYVQRCENFYAPSLKQLDILINVNFTSIKRLVIDLPYPLKDLEKAKFIFLKELFISNNSSITQKFLESDILGKLEILSLTNCQLKNLNFLKHCKFKDILGFLQVDSNLIQSIKQLSSQFQKLTFLNLSYNLIVQLQPLTKWKFSNINYLLLDGNQIKSLQFLYLLNLTQINEIHMDSNKINLTEIKMVKFQKYKLDFISQNLCVYISVEKSLERNCLVLFITENSDYVDYHHNDDDINKNQNDKVIEEEEEQIIIIDLKIQGLDLNINVDEIEDISMNALKQNEVTQLTLYIGNYYLIQEFIQNIKKNHYYDSTQEQRESLACDYLKNFIQQPHHH